MPTCTRCATASPDVTGHPALCPRCRAAGIDELIRAEERDTPIGLLKFLIVVSLAQLAVLTYVMLWIRSWFLALQGRDAFTPPF